MKLDFDLLYSQLPLILEYFMPGIIFVVTFRYFMSKKFSSIDFLYSFIIGYLLKSSFACVHMFIFTSIHPPMNIRVLILSISSLCLSIFIISLLKKKFVKNIFDKINHKGLYDDAWINHLDYNDGTVIYITCKDDTKIIGTLLEHEEKGIDSWFVLNGYTITKEDKRWKSSNYNKGGKIFINARDMKYVEIFYDVPRKENISEKDSENN